MKRFRSWFVLRRVDLALTLGLFLLVLNALLFWLVGLVPGFHVDGFLPALLGSIVVSIVSFALSFLVK